MNDKSYLPSLVGVSRYHNYYLLDLSVGTRYTSVGAVMPTQDLEIIGLWLIFCRAGKSTERNHRSKYCDNGSTKRGGTTGRS